MQWEQIQTISVQDVIYEFVSLYCIESAKFEDTWAYRRSVEFDGHSYIRFEDSGVLLKSLLIVPIEKMCFITYSNVQTM